MITYVAEDMGAQTGLMFSPAQIREFLLPRMKRMIDLAHQAGAYVFHHSDGASRDDHPRHDRGRASTCSTRSSGAARAWSARA